MSGKDDFEEVRRHQAPYSAKHPIPTIGKYKAEKQAREDYASRHEKHDNENDTSSDIHRQTQQGRDDRSRDQKQASSENKDEEAPKDTSEVGPGSSDPKQRRKELKSNNRERAEREVTDPVTHLPVTIHDFTDEALKESGVNDPPPGLQKKTATGLSGKDKSQEQLDHEQHLAQEGHNAMSDKFPPPDFDALREQLTSISKRGFTVGLVGALGILSLALSSIKFLDPGPGGRSNGRYAAWATVTIGTVASLGVFIKGVRDWTAKKMEVVFQDEVWDSQREQIHDQADRHQSETTIWLNSLLESVWPLINPDLFISLGDTLEDVMQASLPRFIRMVSVDDIGQGSESVRVLGVRWLPTGAAAKSVTKDGKLSDDDPEKDKDEEDEAEGQEAAQGMEAEEGDFVNLEVAFAYRSRSSSSSIRSRTKDMHLYLAFYLPGNIKVPVWVNLQGLIGTMRLRLQLTPDPPFFSLCTMTFLGQPKVNMGCVPLSKHGLNIMDVPFISNFVQSAVDAAMAEYVAPKSLTLDLKDMLAGDDFKKDTNARGVLMIHIKKGYDFKMGDAGIPLIKDGSADPYVSVGWAKFGKVLWSTRILQSEMEPSWQETTFVLVTAEEMHVGERLRLQLWDSDRTTADDDLGRIEVDLKELMTSDASNGKMMDRSDGFRALKSGDNMPGKLDWSVGYFPKARLEPCQFEKQTHDKEVKSMEQLKEKVNKTCERKLRETMFREGQTERDESELEQQKAQELKTEQDAMIISAPPPEGFPSGLFSLQIHNITGLELASLSKDPSGGDDSSADEHESGEGLPSAYCEVIVNHRKTFKTRTKPQNAKPFFNAGCERFIRDWRDCEVYVAVRDARQGEDDPLLGIAHLPLDDLFKERAQVMGYWPLTGGIGFGRIRLSMVWRSVQLQAPPSLLGWQFGTVDLEATASSSDCKDDLRSAKLKFRTDLGSGKMYHQSKEDGWKTRRGQKLKLAVESRYTTCLSVAFKVKALTGEDIKAFCVLWLKDIPDEEEQDLELPIWKGDFKRAKANCLDEPGERVGTLKLKLTFWAGMGGAHSRWASKSQNTREVVEVIDTARDNLHEDRMTKEAGIVDSEVTSDSESSDDGEEKQGEKDVPDGSKGQKQGPIDQLKDYKKRNEGLHRQHRGIMQWKAPRAAKWMKHKAEKVEDKVSGIFERQKTGDGIETEV